MRTIIACMALAAAATGSISMLVRPTLTSAKPAFAASPDDASRQRVASVRPVKVFPAQGQPRGFVIFFSDADGWNARSDAVAARMASRGLETVAVDSGSFLRQLDASEATCVHPVEPLVALAHNLQAGLGWNSYVRPALVGSGLGGTLSYATLAQAVPGIFVGGASFDMAGPLRGAKPWCKVNGFRAVRVVHPAPAWQPGPTGQMPTRWFVLDDRVPNSRTADILRATPNGRRIAGSDPGKAIADALAPQWQSAAAAG